MSNGTFMKLGVPLLTQLKKIQYNHENCYILATIMASSTVKPEDKAIDETSINELKAENTSVKNKSEAEINGGIDGNSADTESKICADELKTGNATDQKPTELLEKPPDKNQKIEEQAEAKNKAQDNNMDQTPVEQVAGEAQKSADNNDGEKERETVEKKQHLEITLNESDQKNEKEKISTAQGGLPKWMVQDANAPPSPSPETDANKDLLQTSTSPQKARGRGRGRRPAAEKIAALKDRTAQSSMDDTNAQRPRRSTRTSIDYANPDAVTVLAEVDDEELSGSAKRQKGVRPVHDKGIKRKTVGTSEDEVREDDEDDLDYGAKKKKKRIGARSPGKRGRPVGSKSRIVSKTKPLGRPKRGRNAEKDSEDDDAEVVYDDRVSEKEQTSDDEFEETKPSPNKMKTSAQVKSPAKRRGRPPGRRQGQQPSADNGKTGKSGTIDKTKVDEDPGTNQQTINVEA